MQLTKYDWLPACQNRSRYYQPLRHNIFVTIFQITYLKSEPPAPEIRINTVLGERTQEESPNAGD